jgi:hypothetical protein
MMNVGLVSSVHISSSSFGFAGLTADGVGGGREW